MSNIIGNELLGYVSSQINRRQKAQGSGVDSLRSEIDITYLNSKSSWIKFASAVSISKDKLKKLKLPQDLDGMGLARNNILFGGTSQYLIGDTSLTPKPSNVGLSGYSQTDEWGIVPMPGIESIDVKTLNRGSIEKANIKLKAYSREQFNIIDVLYLRLGYTVLLEWGNSHYLSNDQNSPELEIIRGTLLEKLFFNSSFSSNGDYTSILTPLESSRRKYDGNYDGLLGKISNFDWSFNPDGSYDINITVVSLGSVVESLKSNITPNSTISKFIDDSSKNVDEDDEDSFLTSSPISDDISAMLWLWKFINKDKLNTSTSKGISIGIPLTSTTYNTNYIGRILDLGDSNTAQKPVFDIYVMPNIFSGTFPGYKLTEYELLAAQNKAENAVNSNNFGNRVEKTKRFFTEPEAQNYIKSKNSDKYITDNGGRISSRRGEGTGAYYVESIESINISNIKSISWDLKSVIVLNNKPEQFYIKFGELLKYIQSTVIPSYSSPENPPLFKIKNQSYNNKMYSPPNQISLDPRVCVVRNNKFEKRKNLFAKVLPQISPFRAVDYNPDANINTAYIMNIYLNFNFITDSITSNTDERGNVGFFGLISSLCDGLNKALGGVNNLEPIINKTTNELTIIDSTPLPGTIRDNGEYILEMYGYNTSESKSQSNFVRNINLKTAITPEYATMITVGATAGGYVKGVEATAFSKWNFGLVDRFNSELINNITPTPTGSQDEAQINYAKQYLKKISKCYGFAGVEKKNNSKGRKGIIFDDKAIDNNIGVVTEFYKYLHAKSRTGGSIGFIPFKLSLTLDGISGIRIYNKLHIDAKFLPSNYGDSLDLIVTGISHKLSNDDWETDLELTTMPKNQPLSDIGDIDFGEIKQILINNTTTTLPPPTTIGSGDQIRVDFDTTTPYKRSTTMGDARGAYRYLQLITQDGKYGGTAYYPIPGTSALITSGCGIRQINTHPAIDIASSATLPQTCPFIKGKIGSINNTWGKIYIKEINPTTNVETGRAVKFVHTNRILVTTNQIVNFGDIVGHQGTAPGTTYKKHSHMEIMILGRSSSKTTIDGKRTGSSPRRTAGAAYFCPTIEEIKCAHGLSTTPLPLPIKSTSGAITNYKCIV
jgi:hypothetical protein